MRASSAMVGLVDALALAARGGEAAWQAVAAHRAKLLGAIADLERAVHDVRNEAFKATASLELATIEATQNLEQLTDALGMPPTTTWAELLERLRRHC